MPLFTVPLFEANDCHLPAGTPAGGQFCSKSGELPQEARPLPTGPTLIKGGEPFHIKQVGNRRFMYHPTLNLLVLGAENAVMRDSHAEEFDQLSRKTDARLGNYDDYVRGWIGTGRSFRHGVIQFHAINKATAQKYPDLTDRYLRTLEYFLKHGATGQTTLRGFNLTTEKFESRIGEEFPALAPLPPGALKKRPYRPRRKG